MKFWTLRGCLLTEPLLNISLVSLALRSTFNDCLSYQISVSKRESSTSTSLATSGSTFYESVLDMPTTRTFGLFPAIFKIKNLLELNHYTN